MANLYSTVGKLTRWWRGWTGGVVLAVATALLAPDVALSSSTITLNGTTSDGTNLLGAGSLTLNGSGGGLTGDLTSGAGTLSVTVSGGNLTNTGTVILGSNLTLSGGTLSGTSGVLTLSPGTSGTVVLGSGTTSGTLSLGGVLYSGIGTLSITSGTLSVTSGAISVVTGTQLLANGTLFNDPLDPDGDGLSLSLEQILGTNPNIPDTFLEGGVSRRAWAQASVLLSPDYYQLTFVSSPAGLLQRSTQYVSGSLQVSFPYATSQTNGYRFVGWYDLNGARVSPLGSNQSPVVAVNSGMTFTARYVS